jgi:phosphoadenosine phosphosulfate reductase
VSEKEVTVDKKLVEMSLEGKETHSKAIIREAFQKFGNDVAVAFSGGKDSTTLLHLVRTVFDGKIPWKVFTLDTGVEFKEIKAFMSNLAEAWGFDLMVLRNNAIADADPLPKDKAECCYTRKVIPVNAAIVQHNLKAVVTAVRWDEQSSRINEQFFVPKETPSHVRVQPVLHFKEFDIWSYIKKYAIPYCELYKKGYRSIDCEPCTTPFGRAGVERGGRDLDKEKVMERLREAGYF